MGDLSYKRIHFFNVVCVLNIVKILTLCGKNMAQKYDIHHWDNSSFKNFLIVYYGLLKNRIYLIIDEKKSIGTIQISLKDDFVRFSKLAIKPSESGNGYGSQAIDFVISIGKKHDKKRIICEVYDKSQHAIDFYLHKGFIEIGKVKTLKYCELVMEREIA